MSTAHLENNLRALITTVNIAYYCACHVSNSFYTLYTNFNIRHNFVNDVTCRTHHALRQTAIHYISHKYNFKQVKWNAHHYNNSYYLSILSQTQTTHSTFRIQYRHLSRMLQDTDTQLSTDDTRRLWSRVLNQRLETVWSNQWILRKCRWRISWASCTCSCVCSA